MLAQTSPLSFCPLKFPRSIPLALSLTCANLNSSLLLPKPAPHVCPNLEDGITIHSVTQICNSSHSLAKSVDSISQMSLKNYLLFSSITTTVIQATQIIFHPDYRSSLPIVNILYPLLPIYFVVPTTARVVRARTKSHLIAFYFVPHLAPPTLSVTASLVSYFLQLTCSYPTQALSQGVLSAHDHSPPHPIIPGNG